MSLHSFFVLLMYVRSVRWCMFLLRAYSVHTPCMNTEALYTVDEERLPRLRTD